MSPIKAALAAVLGLFILTTSLGSFYTIDEGERGVITWNGKVTGVADAGLHWKMPFIVDVHKISTRDYTHPYPKIEVYTRDQQVATVNVSVTYRVNPATVQAVYTQFGDLETLRARVLDRKVSEELEKVFGQFNAERAVQERAALGVQYASHIKAIESPLEIVSVQIENFSLPDTYEDIINERMKAEVEVRRLEQAALQAKVQAEITVTQAQAVADSQLATAKANAEAVRMQGEAEADAIRVKAAALRDNAGLIELTKAERWDGVLPTTMLPNTTIPFLTK